MMLVARMFLFQARLTLRTPTTVQVLVSAPLYTVMFLAITRHAGRGDLTSFAVLAPVLMSLWSMSLLASGELVTGERDRGTLEGMLATPADYHVVVVARSLAIIALSMLSFGESWLVARIGFGITVTIGHPLLFAAGVLMSGVAMAGTATVLAALFVLTPSARVLQNSLSFPFYLLSGVLVPVAELPAWLHPLSRLVFLSWSADLLRSGLDHAPATGVIISFIAIAVLALLGLTVGGLLFRAVLRRAQIDGTLART
ncbi:ABC transporter permease [Streptomyces asiaticus]